MISRTAKALYYSTLSPLMRLNQFRHRWLGSQLKRSRRVHLGPGQENYLSGWINVDANIVSSNPDIWADLRGRLPFPDSSVEAFYSHHVIEHLPNLDAHFRDMFRCLSPGGVLRVGGPHGDNAIRAFAEGRHEWFGDWPTRRRSLGGRFENFIFCKGEHLTILTESFLRELLEDAGFVSIQTCRPQESGLPQIFDEKVFRIEPCSDPSLPHTLLMEARKPGPGVL